MVVAGAMALLTHPLLFGGKNGTGVRKPPGWQRCRAMMSMGRFGEENCVKLSFTLARALVGYYYRPFPPREHIADFLRTIMAEHSSGSLGHRTRPTSHKQESNHAEQLWGHCTGWVAIEASAYRASVPGDTKGAEAIET
ncbi:hypothetical protein L1887_56640 [Cichorium endivia]|nr:hypothetical protein L1887_56640 [Cichorium endivia]